MATFISYWHATRKTLSYYLGGIYRYLFEKDIFLWAQAIAFKVLITIVPIIILATGILGRWLDRPDAFADVARYIQEYIPDFERSQAIIDFVGQLQASGDLFAGLGIVILLFAAMTVFTTLRVVIGNVFQEEWHRHRSVIGGYLFDIRMVVQVGLLFVLTVGLSALTQVVQQGGLDAAISFGLDYVWLREGWRETFKWLSYLIPYLLSAAMFFQLFYFVPQPHPPKRSAFVGAVFTGLLWEAAKLSFTFYATHVGRFERYNLDVIEGQELLGALGQAFGLLIAFVFWIYYSGIVLTLGALIAVLNEKRVRMRRLQRERERMERSVSGEPRERGGRPKRKPDDAEHESVDDHPEAAASGGPGRDSGDAKEQDVTVN